eukprot:9032599-Pyramimonas_sp.AAC.1
MQREEARNLANQLAAAEDRANQLMAEAEGRANQLMAAAAESEREKGRATAAEEAEVSRGARRSRFWDFPAFSVFCEDGFNARCVALRGLDLGVENELASAVDDADDTYYMQHLLFYQCGLHTNCLSAARGLFECGAGSV